MLGELAGGVAHDINTPISAIKSGLLMLKETVKSDDEKMLVERMDSCATKIVTLTNSLRNQIRNIGSDEVMDVNITTVVNDMATIIHNDLTKHRVKLNIDIKEDIIVKGNPAKLSQVVTNIVVNAIQAYEDKGGEINLKVENSTKEVVISVEDFAGGIPEHIRESIGKNILTTKGVSGTGFGLYLAYSVIKGAFGGEIRFDTEVGKGTTENDRKIYSLCYPLWIKIQQILRRKEYD
jgi:signal transduction histidine kinase